MSTYVPPEFVRRAREKSRADGGREWLVVEIDHPEDDRRACIVVRAAYADLPDFEAFDGRILFSTAD